eukprot:CAMPEP_0179001752 /NCGR_PEP_ID=MMETSP0795-20121207/11561_1 /TAXON_ID=88552 /ORGANISM="Amoebophrya sp., Strain Ameob2" /LENGTH=361 /DNA_ID=CAMNT_0020695213 /DNA_START=1558 /DNA_END=2643 /DNA_ORIENTATION=+
MNLEAPLLERRVVAAQRPARGRSWRLRDYAREPMRIVYICYATLDHLSPFPPSLLAIVGTLVFFLLLGCIARPSKQFTWLLLQVLRQWALMLLVNQSSRVLHAGPVWAVVLIASGLWVLQLMGYFFYVEGWFLLVTEPFRIIPGTLVFLFLLTYTALLSVKLMIYCFPHSLIGQLFLADLAANAQMNAAEALNQSQEPARPSLSVDVLKLLVQGRVGELFTPRTQAAQLEGKPCAVCCEEFGETDQVISLPCNHVFHHECVLEWFKRGNRECPLCRRDVEETLSAAGSNHATPNQQAPMLAFAAMQEGGQLLEDALGSYPDSVESSSLASGLRSPHPQRRTEISAEGAITYTRIDAEAVRL